MAIPKLIGPRAAARIITKHRDALEPYLCNPRPDGIAAGLRWGISFQLVGSSASAAEPSGATLTLWCAKPEHVNPPGERGRYGRAVLTDTARNALEATCETIAKECGWPMGAVTPLYGADMDTRDTPENVRAEQRLEDNIRTAERTQTRLDRIKRGLDPDNAAPMFE